MRDATFTKRVDALILKAKKTKIMGRANGSTHFLIALDTFFKSDIIVYVKVVLKG